MKTDREALRTAIDLVSLIDNSLWEETLGAIIVPGVRKYSFEKTGELRDIFDWRGGKWARVKRVSE